MKYIFISMDIRCQDRRGVDDLLREGEGGMAEEELEQKEMEEGELSAIILHSSVEAIEPAVDPLGIFLQTNFAGLPIVHAKQTWIFDPDIGLRRRKDYIRLNGDKGEKLIERLGLGIDGREDERLLQQRIRDEGHLGGQIWTFD